MAGDKTRWEQLHRKAHEYHERHPEVWDLFVHFTRNRIALGFECYSACAIFHQIRWETDKPEYALGDDKFKLNDHLTPFYARWFIEEYPKHEGFFRLRDQPSHLAPPVLEDTEDCAT